jgi:hypothetical protein
MLGSAFAAPLFASLNIATGIMLCSGVIVLVDGVSLVHEWVAGKN